MCKTNVIHINAKTNSPDEVYIGRPGPWGNPFEIGKDGNREVVIAKFHEYLRKQLDQNPDLEDQIEALAGKTLVCFCAPKACHGDVLAYFADSFASVTRMNNGELK